MFSAPSVRTRSFIFPIRAFFLCVLSVLSVFSVRNLFFDLCNVRKPRYRAVAERRSAYAAMPARFTFCLSLLRHTNLKAGVPKAFTRIISPRPLRSLYELDLLFFQSGHFFFVFSPCPLCSLCELDLWFFILAFFLCVLSAPAGPSVRNRFFKTYSKAYRAVAERRNAYAAMPVVGVPRRSRDSRIIYFSDFSGRIRSKQSSDCGFTQPTRYPEKFGGL